ncbi:hypothetical protein P2318_29105 [Myxococcaceae bacterium GXIMD 01537]
MKTDTPASPGTWMPVEALDASAPLALIGPVDGGDVDEQVACRTRSQLPLVPGIIAAGSLTMVGPRTLQLDLLLNTNNVSFQPGTAPQLCVTSKDGAVYLPAQSQNVAGEPGLLQLTGRVIFSFNVTDPRQRTFFGFRLKFEEQRIQPRKVVAIANINPLARTLSWSVVDG